MLRRMLIETIRADPEWNGGNYTEQPHSLRMASVFFGIATSGGTRALQKLAPPMRVPTRWSMTGSRHVRRAMPIITSTNMILHATTTRSRASIASRPRCSRSIPPMTSAIRRNPASPSAPSSKPSDGLRTKFPRYTTEDLIEAEYRLLTEGLGIHHLRLVMGNSGGGMSSGAESVRDNDEIFVRIERLAGPEQLARKGCRQHAGARPGRAMQHQHRLSGGRADCQVMQAHFRQDFASVETIVPRDPVVLRGRRIIGGQGRAGG
jgi:hypothetical protein